MICGDDESRQEGTLQVMDFLLWGENKICFHFFFYIISLSLISSISAESIRARLGIVQCQRNFGDTPHTQVIKNHSFVWEAHLFYGRGNGFELKKSSHNQSERRVPFGET